MPPESDKVRNVKVWLSGECGDGFWRASFACLMVYVIPGGGVASVIVISLATEESGAPTYGVSE